MKTLVVLEKSALVLDKIGHVEFFLVEAIMSMQSHDLTPSRIHSLYFFILLYFWKNWVVEEAIISNLAFKSMYNSAII